MEAGPECSPTQDLPDSLDDFMSSIMVLVLKEKDCTVGPNNHTLIPQLLLLYDAHPQLLDTMEMLTQHIPWSWSLTRSCLPANLMGVGRS